MSIFDLDTTKAAEEGAVLELMGPDGVTPLLHPKTKNPVWIKLAGMDSDRYRKAADAAANRRLAVRGRRSNEVKVENVRADAVQAFAAATIDWEGVDGDGDQPLECTPANAARVYAALPWVYEQVDAFIGDRAAFLRSSQPASSPTAGTTSSSAPQAPTA